MGMGNGMLHSAQADGSQVAAGASGHPALAACQWAAASVARQAAAVMLSRVPVGTATRCWLQASSRLEGRQVVVGNRHAMGAVAAGSHRWAGLHAMVGSLPRAGRAVAAGSRWVRLREVARSCRRAAAVHVAAHSQPGAGYATVAGNRLRAEAVVAGSPHTVAADRSQHGDTVAAGTGLTNPLAQGEGER